MTTAPNTPRTQWIRDKGTTIDADTGVLIDELGNFFVDELGFNLLDSVSSDGVYAGHAWATNTGEVVNTGWANVFGGNIPLGSGTRTTVQGDTRVTAQGDTRVTSDGQANNVTPTAWGSDEYA
jgi:hypothetical protein